MGHNHRKGGLTETWRASKQNVVGSSLLDARSIYE
jgi:hypothetical protein